MSIPAPFRNIMEAQKESQLYTLLSIDMPAVDAGGPQLLATYEQRLGELDPLTQEYDDLSLYFHGDSAWLKIDGDGRIILTDALRHHAGITEKVAFVGRGTFFQMWSPEKFEIHRREARERIRQMKQTLLIKQRGSI